MPTAVKTPISMEINQINEQLLTHTAVEASRMPEDARIKSRCSHCDIARHHHLATLERSKEVWFGTLVTTMVHSRLRTVGFSESASLSLDPKLLVSSVLRTIAAPSSPHRSTSGSTAPATRVLSWKNRKNRKKNLKPRCHEVEVAGEAVSLCTALPRC
jgi:hypothetical protein